MTEYSFLNLSPLEFENFSRDILQEVLNERFESFKSGADGGIDLRAFTTQNSEIIVQCKRYKEYSQLKSVLKKEIKKVHTIKPQRYILTTSTPLSKKNKEEIQNILSPYIKSPKDIFGNEDLNNLLNQHQKIEHSYFKLWLSSTNVLNRILHNSVITQSEFEFDQIKETLNVYVQNESLVESKNILENLNFVIISGIPGIGKTTLARMLVYTILADGFDEFIYVSDSINQAFSLFNPEKSQVFFFDDFLGRNFLTQGLNHNEESRITAFIDKVRKSKNKKFILTTREYIFRQAKLELESIEQSNIEKGKYIVDLSKYQRKVKAEILYNHIFFSNLSRKNFSSLLEDKRYLQIIDHLNYNPRLIQLVVDTYATDENEDFFQFFIESLNNPNQIWNNAFESKITELSRVILACTMTLKLPVLLTDLKKCTTSFLKKNPLEISRGYSEIEFNQSIKELEGSFLITNSDDYNEILVDYQNPSVGDFLLNYFRNLAQYNESLIESACFLNQFFDSFSTTFTMKYFNSSNVVSQKIKIPKSLEQKIIERIIDEFDELQLSYVRKIRYLSDSKIKFARVHNGEFLKIDKLSDNLDIFEIPKIRELVKSVMAKNLYPSDIDTNLLQTYLFLLREFYSEIEVDGLRVIQNVFNHYYEFEDYTIIEELEEFFPIEYEIFVNSVECKICIGQNMRAVLESYPSDQLGEIGYYFERVISKYNIKDSTIMLDLAEKIDDWNQANEKMESQLAGYDLDTENFDKFDEDNFIDNMFDSLKE